MSKWNDGHTHEWKDTCGGSGLHIDHPYCGHCYHCAECINEKNMANIECEHDFSGKIGCTCHCSKCYKSKYDHYGQIPLADSVGFPTGMIDSEGKPLTNWGYEKPVDPKPYSGKCTAIITSLHFGQDYEVWADGKLKISYTGELSFCCENHKQLWIDWAKEFNHKLEFKPVSVESPECYVHKMNEEMNWKAGQCDGEVIFEAKDGTKKYNEEGWVPVCKAHKLYYEKYFTATQPLEKSKDYLTVADIYNAKKSLTSIYPKTKNFFTYDTIPQKTGYKFSYGFSKSVQKADKKETVLDRIRILVRVAQVVIEQADNGKTPEEIALLDLDKALKELREEG